MRIFEIIVAGLGLTLLLPVMGIIAIVINRNSQGPVLFRQTRVGKGARPFTCLKFRTMHTGTANRPTHEVGAANITPVGAVLRRYKLDELPQLWNVVKGEMALVGPRPCLPSQGELIELRRQSGALEVLPGITGPAQIAGIDMSKPVELARIDGDYARSRTFLGNIVIIFKTIASIGKKEPEQ